MIEHSFLYEPNSLSLGEAAVLLIKALCATMEAFGEVVLPQFFVLHPHAISLLMPINHNYLIIIISQEYHASIPKMLKSKLNLNYPKIRSIFIDE